ncbi:MAG: minor capsid protein [Clostridia bacterium]|nr:minor capsid protein [Clostridia bacterium]
MRGRFPWYHKQIANAVTQGILQGEIIDKIAKRIGETTGERSRAAMIRNARTAMTSAQNAGRIEAMHQQQGMGITVQKKWIAAHDPRTRPAHLTLHGQTVDVDEPFKSMLGEIMFPGDPAAAPANVYNCRCALGYVYPEYQPHIQRRDNETGEIIDRDITYEEWKKYKVAASPAPITRVTYGKAVSSIKSKYRRGVKEMLDNAPQAIRDVWKKHKRALFPPQFDADPAKGLAYVH